MNKIKTMNREDELEALDKSIKHYDRMIKWVNSRPTNEVVSIYRIRHEIGEDWTSYSCPLCMLYAFLAEPMRCKKKCCYGKVYGSCGNFNNKNAWSEFIYATRWKDWLIAANHVKEQLIKVKEKL